MKLKNQLPISRLIGKIDNDFNLGESDWIPRVAAWSIDALNQMNILPKHRVRRILQVNNRLATLPEIFGLHNLKVYDNHGCEIPLAKNSKCCRDNNEANSISQTILVTNPTSHGGIQVDDHIVVYDINGNPIEYSEIEGIHYTNQLFNEQNEFINLPNRTNRNFVLECRTIELNYDTDFICVETLETATYFDEYYQDCVPYLYDDGNLLEALAWYCLYKYLSRGSKHPVYDLKSSSPVLNPYHHWIDMKSKAKSSVLNAISNNEDGWRSFFYNSTFAPRG